jgi:hypothetical protein
MAAENKAKNAVKMPFETRELSLRNEGRTQTESGGNEQMEIL